MIADLSINYVERFVLTCGYSAERIRADYGTDLIIWAYWLYLQASLSGLDLTQLGNSQTVYLENRNILDEAAVRMFATYKSRVFHQLQERIRYEN